MSDWNHDDVFSNTSDDQQQVTSDGFGDTDTSDAAMGNTDDVVAPAVNQNANEAPSSATVNDAAQQPYQAPVQPPYRQPYYPGQQATPPYGAPQPPFYTPAPPKKKKNGAYVAVAILSVVCCVSLIISGILAVMLAVDNVPNDVNGGPTTVQPDRDDDREVNENAPTLEITDIEEFDDGGLATSEIVSKNLDATVVLTMYQNQSWSYNGYYGFGTEDNDSLTQVGGASGIVMSADGYIITNSHCVYDEENGKKFDRVDVTLYDGRVYEAEIVGFDPTTDLAVIKIDETGLTPAEFGDSSALSLGDRVITLGNSGGLQWSVSQGVLSGQARDVYEDTGYAIKCLQVDAVINPGSSGGPLINAYGQVVGVNSAKIVLDGYEGLGFSIPINEAKDVIDDLVKYGYVTGRVSIGITGRSVTSIGYEGFIIESINNDSALKGTNARVGDIVTHVNGVRVMNYAEMRAELTAHEVGDSVTLTLLRLDRQTRQTQEFDVKITLQESR